MLTTFDADEQVLRALRAGAGGFLLKDTPPAEIVRAVRRVAAGEAMLSPTVTRQLIAHVTAPRRRRPGPAPGPGAAAARRAQRAGARGGGRARAGPVQRGDRRASCS